METPFCESDCIRSACLGPVEHFVFGRRDVADRFEQSPLKQNNSQEIIGAINYLHHNHYGELKSVAPLLEPDREPGSFFIRKIA